MATIISIESGRMGYRDVVRCVRYGGRRRSPRGIDTYDLGHVDVMIATPYDAMPLSVGRNLLPAIGAAEALQLIAGNAVHTLLPRISPSFHRYSEPGGRFHGAYGDRIGDQVSSAVEKLKADRETRQAVVTLWDPVLDNMEGKRDYPCTVALNFAVVGDLLELRTLMRSNDVWLGFPYDVFQFTQLQLTVARALGIEPGPYTHSTWSLHLYAQHADLVEHLAEPLHAGPYQPTGFGRIGDDWPLCRWRADAVLDSTRPNIPGLTESERWYVDQLKSYKRG